MKRSGMGAGSWELGGFRSLPSICPPTPQTPCSPRRYLQVTGAWSKSPNLLWNFLQVLQSKTSGFFRWLKQPEPSRAQAPQRESTQCCLLHPWHFRTGCRGEQKHLVGLSPEAWALRTPARCEGRIPRCPGLGLAPDSELASVGVSIATYTYTWHPATAATQRGAGQAKPLRACGVAGAGGGAGLGRVQIFGWPPPQSQPQKECTGHSRHSPDLFHIHWEGRATFLSCRVFFFCLSC